jgi:hypothetical protein
LIGRRSTFWSCRVQNVEIRARAERRSTLCTYAVQNVDHDRARPGNSTFCTRPRERHRNPGRPLNARCSPAPMLRPR